MKNNRVSSGFSLLELLMAVVIMTMMIAVMYNIFQISSKVWSVTDSKVEMLQNVRIFLDKMSLDLDSAIVQTENNMNFIVTATSIYFVNNGIYNNGGTEISGYQEVGFFYDYEDGNDTNFTNDSIKFISRHIYSETGFQFEADFNTLKSTAAYELALYVVDVEFKCWNHLSAPEDWIDWASWPGSPSDPEWNVIDPISSSDPDDPSYESTDPSNLGKMPRKIQVTLKMIQPETAEWVNGLNVSSFNSYTSGQSGSKREKILAALTERGLLREYHAIMFFPDTE